MTRSPYISALVVGLLATLVIWAFIAGWAGQVVFWPDNAGTSWLEVLIWLTIMYGPPAFALWGAMRLLLPMKNGEAD